MVFEIENNEASFSSEIIKNYLRPDSVFVDIGAADHPDEILRNRKVDFIKIDAGGHEIEILSGLGQTIQNNDKMAMLIALAPEAQEKAGYRPRDLLKIIKKLGYDIFLIDEHNRKYIRLTDKTYLWGQWISDIKKNWRSANIFCVPKGHSIFVTFFAHAPLLTGGAERCLLELIEQVRTQGVLCHVILPREGPFTDALKGKAVSYDVIEYHWWTTHFIGQVYSNLYTNLIKPAVSILKTNPHLVYTNTVVLPWGAISAAVLNKPHIWHIREFGEKDHGLKFVLEFKKRAGFISFFSDRVVYMSKALRDEHEKYIKTNKSRILYDVAPVPQSCLEGGVDGAYRLEDSLKLIMVGRIAEPKGQHLAVEALYELDKEGHKAELLILGDHIDGDEYVNGLKRLVESKGLKNVYFKDFVSNPFPYIKQADILLMCSRCEAFGRVTVEAMMLKKPVIGSNSGGTIELIKDGFNGFLYEAGNAGDLKNKIGYFVKNKEQILKMGENGSAFVKENFSLGQESLKYRNLFKGLRDEKRPFWGTPCKRFVALLLIGVMAPFYGTSYLLFKIVKLFGTKFNRHILKNARAFLKSLFTKLPKGFLTPRFFPIDPRLTEEFGPFSFPAVPDTPPDVSIIVPVYNQWKHTYNCLKTLNSACAKYSFEVILADDGSTDGTLQAGALIKNLIVIRDGHNRGFVLNCNHAAKSARGRHLYFVNNDTKCAPGCIDRLVEVFEQAPKAGIVGSKLLYPDGLLQEAGNIVWSNGNISNYGKGQDPLRPEFCYRREADYVSGCSMMIRKELWKELNGFDVRFSPAYCDDVDLCFAARSAGYRVILQPESMVIHYEGASHGKDIKKGIKKFQEQNMVKLAAKWESVLKKDQFPAGCSLFHARDRSKNRPTVLIIDHRIPWYDKDADDRTVWSFIQGQVALGHNVKFIGDDFYPYQPYTDELQRMGVEVLCGAWYNNHWEGWLKENGRYIDHVWLNRSEISVKYIKQLCKYTKARLMYPPFR